VSGQVIALQRDEVPFPPGVEEYFQPAPWGLDSIYPWVTKSTLLVLLTCVVLLLFFTIAYRKPQLVPGRTQWIAESVYGFVRNNAAIGMIGHEGIKFAPYLTTLFCFILLNNLYGLIPGIQFSPNSHIAFPAILAVISYVLFIWVGIQRHGVGRFFKNHLIPPAPWFAMPLLIPIEFVSNFIFRPLTLALRLFANMFAGHMILLVFTLGGFALLNAEAIFIKPISLLSWLMAIALTVLELLIAALQAYVFVILTSSYVQGALAEDH